MCGKEDLQTATASETCECLSVWLNHSVLFHAPLEEVKKRKLSACHQTCLHDRPVAVSLISIQRCLSHVHSVTKPLTVSAAAQFLTFTAKEKTRKEKQ